MKKTLHILALSRRAGVELMFINYLKYMKEKEPEKLNRQIVFALNLSTYFKEELDKLKVTYYVNNSRKGSKILSILKRILRMKKIIKKHEIDIVYGQNLDGNYNASLACLLNRRIRLVCHEHGTAWTNRTITSLMTTFWTKSSNKIICNSNAAKTILNKRFKVKNKKIRVIYNGVPFEDIKKVGKMRNCLLFVGRLDYVKSPETIIEAMPFIIEEIPEIHLDILGDGELFDVLSDLILKFNLQKHVTLRGNVKNVSEYMARSSLLVVPSIREAFGNVIVEAAFQKTPTIGTNIDGIAEIIVQNLTGILIDPEIEVENINAPKFVVKPELNELVRPKQIRPELLANEIISLLRSDAIKEMGYNARNHVKTRFSFNTYYYNVVKELIVLK